MQLRVSSFVRNPGQAESTPAVKRRRWVTICAAWILLAAAVDSRSAMAADLTIAAVRGEAGGTATVSVKYQSRGAEVAAIQFDLEFDRTVLTIAPAVGAASTSAGKSLSTAILPNGHLRFVISGINRTALADGSVAELTIHIRADATLGPQTLKILRTVAADPVAQPISVRVNPGVLIVVPRI